MRNLQWIVLLVLFGSLLPGLSLAQEEPGNTSQRGGGNPEQRRARWESMSEEEREAKRSEMRARRDSMSEEERQEFRARRQARFESMSDEEKQAMRERRASREHQGGQEGGREGGGHQRGSQQGRGSEPGGV